MGFRGSSSGGGGGDVAFAGPSGQIDLGDVNNEGAVDASARADHAHAFPGPTGAPPDVAGASTTGDSNRSARQNHTHGHTAAQHLDGGHADLTTTFAAIAAPGAAVAAHEGAADPHAVYQLEADALAGGDVVLQALADAKGDTIAATGPDAWARVPAGVDGEFFVADSSQPAGVKFAAGPTGGVTDHGALTGLADDDHPQYLQSTAVQALASANGNDTTTSFPAAFATAPIVTATAFESGIFAENWTCAVKTKSTTSVRLRHSRDGVGVNSVAQIIAMEAT